MFNIKSVLLLNQKLMIQSKNVDIFNTKLAWFCDREETRTDSRVYCEKLYIKIYANN